MREIKYDIAKGLGIILMVAAHANIPAKSFIYLFHMPLFFIISGYFFKPEYCKDLNSLLQFIKKQWKRLILPYILFCSLCIILNNFFLDTNIYTNSNEILNIEENWKFNTARDFLTIKQMLTKILNCILIAGGAPLGPACWFLRTLFWITVSYSFFYYLVSKLHLNHKFFKITNLCLCILASSFGYYLQKINFNFYCFGSIFSAIFLFYIGTLLKQYNKFNQFKFISFFISFSILLIAFINNIEIELSQNKYPNLLILTILSICGYYFIMFISEKLEKNIFISNILIFITNNSIPILLWHIIAFKLVNYIQIIVYNLPEYYLAAIPVIYSRPYWYILYTIVGLGIPILLNYLYRLLKKMNILIKHKYTN